MRLSPLTLLVLAATLGGCAVGSIATVAIGPAIGLGEGIGSGVQASLEYTLLAHERTRPRLAIDAPPGATVQTHPDRDSLNPSRLGIGAVAALTGGWQAGETGWSSSALAGVDFTPIASDGAHVNFGVAFGYGANKKGHGFAFMAPRLGFAVTPWEVGNGRLGLGLRMTCQFGASSTCGPALTATRLEFGE